MRRNTAARVVLSVAVATLLLLAATARAQEIIRMDRKPLDPADVYGREMRLAEAAPDRASRHKHWREALAANPNHPMNIVIESRIATELAQRVDKARGEYPKSEEELNLYIEIATKYNHMDYYRPRPTEETWGAQSLVPRAALHAGAMLFFEKGETEKAREYLLQAMADIEKTWRRRTQDWQDSPKPTPSAEEIGPDASLGGAGKYKRRVAEWQRRREAAAKGDVLGEFETRIIKVAVQYCGQTYGRQRPEDVPIAMNEIIRRFPGTPIAKVAQGHIDRASKMVTQGILRDFDADADLLAEGILDTAEKSAPARLSRANLWRALLCNRRRASTCGYTCSGAALL